MYLLVFSLFKKLQFLKGVTPIINFNNIGSQHFFIGVFQNLFPYRNFFGGNFNFKGFFLWFLSLIIFQNFFKEFLPFFLKDFCFTKKKFDKIFFKKIFFSKIIVFLTFFLCNFFKGFSCENIFYWHNFWLLNFNFF